MVQELAAAVRKFDVAVAECFAADRDHLLGAIETGYVSLTSFNEVFAQLMGQVPHRLTRLVEGTCSFAELRQRGSSHSTHAAGA